MHATFNHLSYLMLIITQNKVLTKPTTANMIHSSYKRGTTCIYILNVFLYRSILKHVSIHYCVHRVDQALTTLAMRKFCEDKVSSSLQPSQNRCETLVHLPVSYTAALITSFIHLSCSGTSTTLTVCSPVPSK